MVGVLRGGIVLCILFCSVPSLQGTKLRGQGLQKLVAHKPPRITHISDRTSTSFDVHLDPPMRTNPADAVVKYAVRVSDSLEEYVMTTTHRRLRVSGLSPYRHYSVWVAAETRLGQSPFSRPFLALTDTAAPSAPQNLKWTQVNSTSVRLEWTVPTNFYKAVDFYTVEVLQDGKQQRSISTENSWVELEGLESGVNLLLRVSATTRSIFTERDYRGDNADIGLRLEERNTTPESRTTTSSSQKSTTTESDAEGKARPVDKPSEGKKPARKGVSAERLATRTAMAKLNWLRSGHRAQLAQAALAKVQTQVAALEKVKLDLEIARLREEL